MQTEHVGSFPSPFTSHIQIFSKTKLPSLLVNWIRVPQLFPLKEPRFLCKLEEIKDEDFKNN